MANIKFDRDSVSNEDFRSLMAEAERHGDADQAELCRRALEDGDSDAAEQCIDAIEAAAAMVDAVSL
jgi:hypothetical protein